MRLISDRLPNASKKKVVEISAEEQLLSEVQYTIVEEKFGPDVKCIAVGKIELADDSEDFSELNKVEIVRRTLVSNTLSTKLHASSTHDSGRLPTRGCRR